MTIEELIILGKKHLHSNEAKMLLASILKYDTLELLNHLDEIISIEIVDKYKTCIEAVENNIPLQYVIRNKQLSFKAGRVYLCGKSLLYKQGDGT